MADTTHRRLTVERVAPGQFVAVNDRGGRLAFGTGGDEEFTPTELLLIAIGGCTAIDIDIHHDAPGRAGVVRDRRRRRQGARRGRQPPGERRGHLPVTFPDGAAGDKARAVLPDAVRKSHDRLCTVGRTVELPTPITDHIE